MTTAGWPRCSARSAAWIAAALAAMSRRRARLSAALIWLRVSLAAPGRVRGLAQQLQGVGGVEVLERLQRGREVLPQRVPQPLHLPGPFPDQRLVRPGHDLDRLGLRAVTGDRAQLVRVGPHHVGQHVRVRRVALGPGHRQAFPVPGRLQRVHRDTPCTRRRPAPAPTGPGRSRSRSSPGRRRPRCRRRAPGRSSRAAWPCPPCPPAAGPWPTGGRTRPSARRRGGPPPSHLPRTATHRVSRLSSRITTGSQEENHQRPNEAVLTPQPGGHDIPSAINSPHRPAGARSLRRTPRPGGKSAHQPDHPGQPSLPASHLHSCAATGCPPCVRSSAA